MTISTHRLLPLLFAGCAGLTACTGMPPGAHVYSPAEKQMLGGSLGVPTAQLDATGEARYCSTRSGQKKLALDSIAAACGGADRYFITGELVADAVYSVGMIQTTCPMGSGRVIYFNCAGKTPR